MSELEAFRLSMASKSAHISCWFHGIFITAFRWTSNLYFVICSTCTCMNMYLGGRLDVPGALRSLSPPCWKTGTSAPRLNHGHTFFHAVLLSMSWDADVHHKRWLQQLLLFQGKDRALGAGNLIWDSDNMSQGDLTVVLLYYKAWTTHYDIFPINSLATKNAYLMLIMVKGQAYLILIHTSFTLCRHFIKDHFVAYEVGTTWY